MARFKVGDRVQLTGDISRFYRCITGILADSTVDHASVLIQYAVRLGDGTLATVFDFQLQIPPVVRGRIVSDSAAAKTGTEGAVASQGRYVDVVGADVKLHLKISGLLEKSIAARVSVCNTAIAGALLTVLDGDRPIATESTNTTGEAQLRGLPSCAVALEAVVPGKRLLIPLSL